MAGLASAERISMLHGAVLDKCNEFGQATLALRSKPEELLEQNLALQAEIARLLDEDEARRRHEASVDGRTAERAALEQLAHAQEAVQARDGELRRTRIALEATRADVQKLAHEKAALQRELAAERSELHKLRLERRVTELPTGNGTRGGAPTHRSPRQLEHPELTSPRQVVRQQQRAASAAATRSHISSGAASPRHRALASARPMSAAATTGHSRGREAAAPPPAAHPHAPTSTSARPASARPAYGGAPQYLPTGVPAVHAEAAAEAGEVTGARDLASCEAEVRELRQANARLQTALLAAALDPDGTGESLSHLLAHVDRGLAVRSLQRRGQRAVSSVAALSARAHSPPTADKPWPFPASKLPKGTRLPAGYSQWPPMA